ncbi:MAG: extracellular solute-binding protein [Anaerolineae bacterium]|nr:extracellular solute-binding protein [Anaerolineae bacterium]
MWASVFGMGATLDAPEKGLEFFKQLAESGNLLSTVSSAATLAKGETPIGFHWDYNNLAYRDANKDIANLQVIYPKSGTVAGVYLHGINAYSPRPYAARLWAEYLYSDAGQLTWLSGYAKPARYDDLVKRGVISAELAAQLPVVDAPISFPTFDQLGTGLSYIRENWPKVVGVTLTK